MRDPDRNGTPTASFPLVIAFFLTAALCSFILPLNACLAGDLKEVALYSTPLTEATKASLEQHWPGTSQLILVRNDGPLPHNSILYAFLGKDRDWTLALGPIPATTGRNGFAKPLGKREGDGRTPVGVYPLGFAFGYLPGIDSAMPYRQMTRQDIWVDDPRSPDYNRLKKRAETAARSFEDMVLPDDRYKHGIVIEYNTHPIIPGLGSAIFLHIWKDPATPTAGCVAISEENLLKLIHWLDPAKKPLIVIEK